MNEKLNIKAPKHHYWLVLILFMASCHSVVVQVDEIPSNTPANDPIYIAGNFNRWDPGSERYILALNDDSTYTVELPKGIGAIEYKFTRGDWKTVEKNVCGYDIDNRRFILGDGDTINSTIASWNDLDAVNCDRITIVVEDIPQNTPKELNLAVAGNFNSWIPNRDSRMIKDSTGRFVFTIERVTGMDEIEYKITREDMSTVETDVFGNDIPVRKLQFGTSDTIYIKVENWKDMSPKASNNVIVICKKIPENTSAGDNIFLISNINSWNPSDQNYKLSRNSDGYYEISLPRLKRNMDFKFTRGDWSSVEVDRFGYEISNRNLNFREQDTLYVEIDNWKDKSSITDEEVTIFLERFPESTPEDSEIYLAGNMNGWDANDRRYRMELNEQGNYLITIPRDWGNLEFKFTRGSWNSVEVSQNGSDVPNHQFLYRDIDTLRLNVENWGDLPLDNTSGVTLILRNLPNNTPEDAEFYFVSDINNWRPGSLRYRFTEDENGIFFFNIPRRNRPIDFKITRGSWGNVEVDEWGNEVPNRSFYFGFTDTLYIDIPKWRDFGGKY